MVKLAVVARIVLELHTEVECSVGDGCGYADYAVAANGGHVCLVAVGK